MVEQTQTGTEPAADAGQQQKTVDNSGDAGVQQTTTPADGENQDVNAQIDAFKAKAVDETKKRQSAEEEARIAHEQMAIMTANQTVQQPAVAPTPPLTVYEQARTDLGLGEEEYPTETQRGQIIQRAIEIQNAVVNQQRQAQVNQQFIQSHPDYGEVVGRQMGNNFQLSPELLKIVTDKPHLANAAYSNSQAAYKIVMDERKLAEFEKSATASQEHLERQGIDNKTEPLGGSAAGGGGVGDPNNRQMMSREQVKEIRRKLANGDQV